MELNPLLFCLYEAVENKLSPLKVHCQRLVLRVTRTQPNL